MPTIAPMVGEKGSPGTSRAAHLCEKRSGTAPTTSNGAKMPPGVWLRLRKKASNQRATNTVSSNEREIGVFSTAWMMGSPPPTSIGSNQATPDDAADERRFGKRRGTAVTAAKRSINPIRVWL